MNKEDKIIFILRLTILVLLVLFLIVFNKSIKTDCQDCLFEIDGELYDSQEFFNMYVDRCLSKKNINLAEINITGQFTPETC